MCIYPVGILTTYQQLQVKPFTNIRLECTICKLMCIYPVGKLTTYQQLQVKPFTNIRLECTVNGAPSQIPMVCVNVANSRTHRWTDEQTHSRTPLP